VLQRSQYTLHPVCRILKRPGRRRRARDNARGNDRDVRHARHFAGRADIEPGPGNGLVDRRLLSGSNRRQEGGARYQRRDHHSFHAHSPGKSFHETNDWPRAHGYGLNITSSAG